MLDLVSLQQQNQWLLLFVFWMKICEQSARTPETLSMLEPVSLQQQNQCIDCLLNENLHTKNSESESKHPPPPKKKLYGEESVQNGMFRWTNRIFSFLSSIFIEKKKSHESVLAVWRWYRCCSSDHKNREQKKYEDLIPSVQCGSGSMEFSYHSMEQ